MKGLDNPCKTAVGHAKRIEMGPDALLILCSDLLCLLRLPIGASNGEVETLQSAYAALARRAMRIPPERL